MAKYDHGGGCPCGLYAECDPDCRSYVAPKEKPVKFQVEVTPLLRELSNRIHKLPYRDLMTFTYALSGALGGMDCDVLAKSLLQSADAFGKIES